jgi:hypothetical protein
MKEINSLPYPFLSLPSLQKKKKKKIEKYVPLPVVFFQIFLERSLQWLEDVRSEQVNAAVDGRAHKRLWFLHIVQHL